MNLKKILRIITFASNRRHRWASNHLCEYRICPNLFLASRRAERTQRLWEILLERELKGKED